MTALVNVHGAGTPLRQCPRHPDIYCPQRACPLCRWQRMHMGGNAWRRMRRAEKNQDAKETR